jgi:hypothetical protein
MGFVKKYRVLAGIFLLALIIRLLPLSLGTIVGLDSYLHRDIAMRVLETGSLLSYDPGSLLGIKAYSYPPGFHVLLASFMLFLPPNLASQVLPALLGGLTVVVVYFITMEIFDDEKISLFSAFFLATAPNHVFRTAAVLPEALGVFFFSLSLLAIIRYTKTQDIKYALFTGFILILYLLSHRGWFILFLSVTILVLVLYGDILKSKRNLIALAFLSAISYPIIKNLFFEMLLRIPRVPVNALGYPKWVGIIQLALGVLGMILLAGNKDRLKIFLIVWGIFLLGVGSISFRFRDPYGAIPMSMLAGYALVTFVLPNLPKSGRMPKIALVSILLISTFQGAHASLNLLEFPKVEEVEVFYWLKDNSPEDSIVLTWKEEGYYIIGIAERKDIVTWKKIYQGFFEEPPAVADAKQSYIDVATIFRSTNRERALSLIDFYSIDYVYIDRRMRAELGSLEYGLFEYLSYDTHFKPLIANGVAELYRFEPESIKPENQENIDFDKNAPLSGFGNTSLFMASRIEGQWNGFAYMSTPEYRADYVTNARIALLYLKLYDLTGNVEFRDRATWLLRFLSFEQLESGGWANQNYNMPRDSVVVTCQITGSLIDIYEFYPEADVKSSLDRSSEYLYSQLESDGWIRTFPLSTTDVYTTDGMCLPVMWKLSQLYGEKYALASGELAGNLVNVQLDDGSWTYGEESIINNVNSQTVILEGMSTYYALSGDEKVAQSVNNGVAWLDSKQNSKGQFADYLIEKTGKSITPETSAYTRAVYIYELQGMEDNTLEYLMETYEPGSGKEPIEDLVYVADVLVHKALEKD